MSLGYVFIYSLNDVVLELLKKKIVEQSVRAQTCKLGVESSYVFQLGYCPYLLK